MSITVNWTKDQPNGFLYQFSLARQAYSYSGAYYYVPLALYSTGAAVSASYPPLEIGSLGAIFPAFIVGASLVGWLRFPFGGRTSAPRLMLVCGIVCAACLLYAFAPVPRVAGLRTPDMLFFMAWFLAAIAGLASGSVRIPTVAWQRGFVGTVILAATLISILAVIPFITGTMVRDPVRPETAQAGWQPLGPTDNNFRVASPTDNPSVWLNGVYDVPQTRGYAAIPQIPNPAWQFWLDSTLWNGDAAEPQRTFLLDWYAVKWIYVPAPYMPSTTGVLPKLQQHPELYQRLASTNSGESLTFSYMRPTPVALATNAPNVLVVGAPENYEVVFRDLSYSGFDSAHVIPVQGGAYVDDYSVEDLNRFDEVLIYGGRAHDTARAFDLLNRYVRTGGGLVVEASGSPLGASEPFPFPTIDLEHRQKGWPMELPGGELAGHRRHRLRRIQSGPLRRWPMGRVGRRRGAELGAGGAVVGSRCSRRGGQAGAGPGGLVGSQPAVSHRQLPECRGIAVSHHGHVLGESRRRLRFGGLVSPTGRAGTDDRLGRVRRPRGDLQGKLVRSMARLRQRT